MTEIALSRLHYPVTTLGPGKRIGVWLQGCSIKCPGCISTDTWENGVGKIKLRSVVAALRKLAPNCDGLTISGGEPFDQSETLASLLSQWRSFSQRTVFVFTGYELQQISSWLESYPGLIDAIMTGPFRSDYSQTKALRGSDNQTLNILTEAGKEFRHYDRPLDKNDKKLDVMFDENGHAWFAGIPLRGDLGGIRRLLSSSGHIVEMSDRAPRR